MESMTFSQKTKELEVTFTTKKIQLGDVVEDFEFFLKGCGFIFDHLEVVVKDNDGK